MIVYQEGGMFMYWLPKLEPKEIAITQKERGILRELASKYAEIASEDRQKEIKERMFAINCLQLVRPIVLIDELPWHEINVDDRLDCLCENELAVKMETFFRRALLQRDYFPCDRYFEAHYPLPKTYKIEGGLIQDEDLLVTNEKSHIASHGYHDQLRDDSDLEKLTPPVVEAYPDFDRQRLELVSEILAGILPVRLQGVDLWYSPWDEIPTLHGVTQTFTDLVDRPEFMHAIMKKLTENMLSLMEQLERLGLLAGEKPLIHCVPAFARDLPATDYDGGDYRLKDIWFRGMAQMFSDVSPKQHEEFDLEYMKPLFAKCGLGYYGCCEALHNKIDMVKKIPNLRRIGVSSWADRRLCAEQIGGDYVFSRKPNPATLALKTDPDVVRAEVLDTLEACRENNCVWEYVLKDVSTVGSDINNLVLWERTVRETLDTFY